MKNIRNVLWGVILVVVGVIIACNSLGLTNINIFFKGWWTIFIIAPCFINLFKDNDKTGSLIGILIGVMLLVGFLQAVIVDSNITIKLKKNTLLILFDTKPSPKFQLFSPYYIIFFTLCLIKRF